MPHAQQTTARPAPAMPLLQAFSVICSCCESTGNTPEPALPAGWATETINDTTSAYCPDCAIDLPEADAQ